MGKLKYVIASTILMLLALTRLMLDRAAFTS